MTPTNPPERRGAEVKAEIKRLAEAWSVKRPEFLDVTACLAYLTMLAEKEGYEKGLNHFDLHCPSCVSEGFKEGQEKMRERATRAAEYFACSKEKCDKDSCRLARVISTRICNLPIEELK